MRRTFVYKAAAEHQPSKPTGECYRKRKRSPEPPPEPHTAANTKKPTGRDAVDNVGDEEEDDDCFDDIGLTAVELDELTQRELQVTAGSEPTTIANFPRLEEAAALASVVEHITVEQPRAERGLASGPVAGTPASAANVPQPPTRAIPPSQQQQQQRRQQQLPPANTLVNAHSSNHISRAPVPAPTTAPHHHNHLQLQPSELLDKIRELQEANYCRDGEAKVLRSEKERLAEELRRKEEAARDVQTRLLTEREDLEHRYAREKEALTTTLTFNQQELTSLRERCRALEDRLRRSAGGQLTDGKPAAAAAVTKAMLPLLSALSDGGKDVDDVLADAWSASQPVAGTKRPSSMVQPSFHSFETFGQDHHLRKKPTMHTPPHPPSLTRTHLLSNGGPPAPHHPLERANVFTQVKQEEEEKEQVDNVAVPATVPPKVAPSAAPSEAPMDQDCWDYKQVMLDIPELSGPQLLMLLANPSLNRPVAVETSSSSSSSWSGTQAVKNHQTEVKPFQRARSHMMGLEEEEEDARGHPLREPWSPDPPQKLTGLLSLLHLKTPSSIFPVNTRALSASVVPPEEVRGDHLRPDSLMRRIRNASSSAARKGVTEMEPNPVGRFKPDPSSSSSSSFIGPAVRGVAPPSPAKVPGIDLTGTPPAAAAADAPGSQTRIAAFEEWNPTKSTSLARGVDPNWLEAHISLILSTADPPPPHLHPFRTGTGSSHHTLGRWATPLPSSPTPRRQRPPLPHPDQVGDMASTLLPHLAGVLVSYHREQLLKARPPLDPADADGTGHLNMSVSTSSSSSVRCEDQLPRSEVNYKVLLEAVTALETLVVCSGMVRAAILAPPPPPFRLESRPSSVVGDAPVYSVGGGDGWGGKVLGVWNFSPAGLGTSRECTPVGVRCRGDVKPLGATPELAATKGADGETEVWKGKRLGSMVDKIPSLSAGVWCERDEVVDVTCSDTPGGTTVSHGCGHLLQTLIDLVAPPWKETFDILHPVVKTLCALAEDCPHHLMDRFSTLLMSDSINVCLDRDDPHIVLDVLALLTSLCECPSLMAAMTSDHADTCVLYTCYQRLVATPTWTESVIVAVQLQIVRLVSSILIAPGGPTVLFEPASQCPCSFELLKSLIALLSNTIDVVTKPSQLTGPLWVLVCELVRLLHTISQEDPYFDSHRQECQHAYTFSLHRLGGWMAARQSSCCELAMVKELREYCDGEEDSDSDDT